MFKTSGSLRFSLLAWTLLVMWSTSEPLRAEPIDDYNASLKLYEQKRWDAAAKGFAGFVKAAPEHAKAALAQLYQGQALTHAQKYPEARTVFREFLKAHPEHPDAPLAAYRVGESSFFLNDFATAASELGDFVTKYPKHDLTGWGWQYLGEAQLQLAQAAQARYTAAATAGKANEATAESRLQYEKASEAVKALNVALSKSTAGDEQAEAKFMLAQAQELLADAYRVEGKTDIASQNFGMAEKLFEEVAASDSAHAPEALFTLAKIDYQAERYQEAAAGFEQLISRFPKSNLISTAELNAAYSYYQIKDYAKSEAHFIQAAQTPNLASNAMFWVGMCRKGAQNWVGAIEVFSDLASKNPQGKMAEKVTFHWADCEAGRKRYAEARQLFESIVTKWPTSSLAGDAHYSAADMALRSGDSAGALALAEAFSTKYPASTLKQLNDLVLGKALLARGAEAAKTDPTHGQPDFTQAAQLFQGVINSSKVPRTALHARIQLAIAQKRLQNFPAVVEALKPIQQMVERGDAGSEAYLETLPLLGEAYLQAGSAAEAEQVLQLTLSKLPADSAADRSQTVMKLAEVRAAQGRWPEMFESLDQLQALPQGTPLAAEAAYQNAERALASQNREVAIQLLTRIVALGEKTDYFAVALSDLGKVQDEDQQYQAAAQTYQKLLESSITHPEVLATAAFNRGLCLKKDAKADPQKLLGAAAAFEEGVQRFAIPKDRALPDENDFRVAKHVVAMARQAATIHAELAPQVPAETEKHIAAADRLWSMAYEQLEKVLPVQDKLPPAEHLTMAPDEMMHLWASQIFNAGNQSRADEIFTLLYQNYPASQYADDAKLIVAQGLDQAGQTPEARALYQSLLSDVNVPNETRLSGLVSWMNLEARVENWPESGRLSEELIAKFPMSSEALNARYRLGESLLMNKTKTAADVIQATKTLSDLRSDPAVSDVKWRNELELLWAEAKLLEQEAVVEKNYEPIRSAIGELLKNHPTGVLADQAHELLGRVEYKESNFPAAREHLESVVKSTSSAKSPLAARAQILIADSYLITKQFDEAMLGYTNVYTNYLYPEYQSAALWKTVDIDLQQKEWKRAEETINTLLKDFPNCVEAPIARKTLDEVRKKLPAP